MKKIKFYILLFISLLIIITMVNFASAEEFVCKVVSVHDGDTFTCENGNKIRIWGIDTPEIPPRVKTAQKGGIEARNFLEKMILNQELECIKKGKSYKRIVAKCSLNSNDIAIPMLKNEYAVEERKYSKGFYLLTSP